MIRVATVQDVGHIATLVRTSFDTRLHDFLIYAQHGIDHFLQLHIMFPSSEPSRHFIVDVGEAGQVNAFAEFHEGADGVDFLSYICVAGEARGKGLAKGLIEHFLARRPQSTTLQLDVFAENHAAIALYYKLGFRQTGGTDWFVRDLPALLPSATVTVNNAVEAAAMFAYYGFCRYSILWGDQNSFVGRIGPRTLRLFSSDDFNDRALLGAMRALFPDACRAVFICPTDLTNRPPDSSLFLKSLRLKR